jgi:hypothetical protein
MEPILIALANGPKCCAADKDIFMLLDIDDCHFGLPQFSFKCSKLLHEKSTNQVMLLDREVVRTASQKLLKEWYIDEKEVEKQLNVDLMVYRARMAVWIQSLPTKDQHKQSDDMLKQRPIDFITIQSLKKEQQVKATFLKNAAKAHAEEERKALRATMDKKNLDSKIKELEVELQVLKAARTELEKVEQQVVQMLLGDLMKSAWEHSLAN